MKATLLACAYCLWSYISLTLTVLVTTIDALRHFETGEMTAQCEGMGEVGSARYEPALLPPCPSLRLLSNSNCQRDPLTPADGPGSVSVNAAQIAQVA